MEENDVNKHFAQVLGIFFDMIFFYSENCDFLLGNSIFMQTQKMKKELQLNDTEVKMMSEVFKVFSKYKHSTRQFGLQLLHSHFSIQNDEILYEVHNKEKRILTTKPIKKKTIKNALATGWQFDAKGNIKVNNLCCDVSTVDSPVRKS